jgi:hypothetical protein
MMSAVGVHMQGSCEWPSDASVGSENHYLIHVSRHICLVASD